MKTKSLILLLSMLSLKAFSQSTEEYYKTGMSLQNEQKYSDAIDNYNKALELDAKYYDAIYQRAYCNNRLKNYDKAIYELKILENKKAWKIKETVLYELGYSYDGKKKGDSAYFYYNEALKINKSYPPPYKALGEKLFWAKKYDLAWIFLTTYNMYTEGKEESNRFWYFIGVVEGIEKKNYSKAIEYLTKSLNIVEDNAAGHHYISDFYVENKEPDKAISHYDRAKKLNVKYDKDLEFWNGLANSYYISSNYLKANEYYKKVLDSNSNNVMILNSIVDIYRNKLKDYPNALEYLNKLYLLDPTDLRPLSEIASVYMDDLKDYTNAEKYYKQILEKDKSENTYLNLAILYETTKKYDNAIEILLTIKPKIMDFGSMGSKDTYSNENYCYANYYLAKIYKEKGDKQNALKHLNIGYNLFGISNNNMIYSLINLKKEIEKMP